MQQPQRYPSQGPPMRNYPQPGYSSVILTYFIVVECCSFTDFPTSTWRILLKFVGGVRLKFDKFVYNNHYKLNEIACLRLNLP